MTPNRAPTKLDPLAAEEVRRLITALLHEASAFGKRPTPLADIRAAARMVESGELTLTQEDRRRLTAVFGRWVDIAWRRLQGAFDFRDNTVWIKPTLHPMQKRFVTAHEIAHAVLPAHREAFAMVDDHTRMPPHAREGFEIEANFGAAAILFQVDQLREEFDSSRPSLRNAVELSQSFGASIVATLREIAEHSHRQIAVLLRHYGEYGSGPVHLYCSDSFEELFRWEERGLPRGQLFPLFAGAREGEVHELQAFDCAGVRRDLLVASMDTGYTEILFVTPVTLRDRAIQRVGGRAPMIAR